MAASAELDEKIKEAEKVLAEREKQKIKAAKANEALKAKFEAKKKANNEEIDKLK